MIRAALLAFVVACSSHKPAPPPPPTTTETPPPSTTPDTPKPEDPAPMGSSSPPPATGAPKLHEKCGANDACEAPAKCETYYGIAGPKGPQFKTCEIKCDKSTTCPTGTKCGVVADGPGQTCR